MYDSYLIVTLTCISVIAPPFCTFVTLLLFRILALMKIKFRWTRALLVLEAAHLSKLFKRTYPPTSGWVQRSGPNSRK